MDEKSNQDTTDRIKVTVHFQPELYAKFQESIFRRECNTDAEGVRACIKYALTHEQSQEKTNE